MNFPKGKKGIFSPLLLQWRCGRKRCRLSWLSNYWAHNTVNLLELHAHGRGLVLNIFFSDADNNNMLDNFAAVVHQAMQCQLCPHTSACGDRSEHVWPRNRSSESWPHAFAIAGRGSEGQAAHVAVASPFRPRTSWMTCCMGPVASKPMQLFLLKRWYSNFHTNNLLYLWPILLLAYIYIYNVVMLLSIKEILVFVGSVKNQL
jgi:hypothetical protein